MSITDFKKKYGKNKKSRQLYNAAIRAECPGGGEVLDLLELVSSMRGRIFSADEGKKLKTIENRLQLIREQMFYDVRERWKIGEVPNMFGLEKRDAAKIIIQALQCAMYATDNPGSSGKDIAKALNLSHSTVVRTWALLRQLGVDIRYQNKKKGFVVLDWGIFNKKKVKQIIS